MPNASHCTFLAPSQGDAFWLNGDHISIKIGGDKTGGRYGLGETRSFPGQEPPPHIHQREDETFYILDGEFEFTLADQTYRRSAGEAIHCPRGVVHQFRNLGGAPGRFLVAVSPSGFERFVAECGIPHTGQNAPPPPDPDTMHKVIAACAKYGIEMRHDWKPKRLGPKSHPRKKLFVLDQHVDLKLTGPQTGGAFCMAEISTRPGSGVALHRHDIDDEMFYVLAGQYEFTLGENGQKLRAGPGSFLHVPRQTYHALRNVGSETARFLDFHTPGGFENFLLEADGAKAEQLLTLFTKYGSEMAR